MLSGSASHQTTDNESVHLNVGDGLTADEVDKVSSDHTTSLSKNGQVRIFVC